MLCAVTCAALSVQCEVWSVECGVWSVECGVWSVECGVWSHPTRPCSCSPSNWSNSTKMRDSTPKHSSIPSARCEGVRSPQCPNEKNLGQCSASGPAGDPRQPASPTESAQPATSLHYNPSDHFNAASLTIPLQPDTSLQYSQSHISTTAR